MRRAVVVLILSLYFLSLGIPASKTPASPERFPASSPGPTDYPWTMFHHDALRSGTTPASSPSAPNLMWTFTTGSYVYPSPVVVDGLVLIPSWDGNLYALDEYNGAQRWVFSTSAPIYATPAVANGVVYLASRDSMVYALNEQTGSLIWQRANISPITSSPVYADGKIFYGTWFVKFNSVLMAVYTNNTVAWQYPGDDTIKSSPAVANGRVIFGQNNGYIVALNETTGLAIWKVPIGVAASISTAPALAYGRVYVGADSNRFLAMNQTTGSIAWTFSIGAFNATSAAVSNGVVYFGTGKGILYALNATTGAQLWTYPKAGTIGGISSSPALALGSKTLLFGSSDHSLYALNATGGALLWKYTTGAGISSSPAVADSRVFFGSWDTKVYGLGVIAPRLQATIFPSVTSLKPGQVSILTITVTNGSAPQSGVTLALSSSIGGGFTQPVMGSIGVYSSNFTAPLVNSAVSSIIQVVASESGFLSGSALTTITLNPFPPLTVAASPTPVSITPGGEIVLMIRVTNGTIPVTGATIFLSSSAGGSFSSPTDGGNGNYTAVYTTPLQASNPTVTIQASKPGFASGQNTLTVTINGIPNLTNLKVVGVPFIYLIAGIALLFLLVLIALVSRRKREPTSPYYHPPVEAPLAYASRPDFGEGLSSGFRGALFTGLAAIGGSQDPYPFRTRK